MQADISLGVCFPYPHPLEFSYSLNWFWSHFQHCQLYWHMLLITYLCQWELHVNNRGTYWREGGGGDLTLFTIYNFVIECHSYWVCRLKLTETHPCCNWQTDSLHCQSCCQTAVNKERKPLCWYRNMSIAYDDKGLWISDRSQCGFPWACTCSSCPSNSPKSKLMWNSMFTHSVACLLIINTILPLPPYIP